MEKTGCKLLSWKLLELQAQAQLYGYFRMNYAGRSDYSVETGKLERCRKEKFAFLNKKGQKLDLIQI